MSQVCQVDEMKVEVDRLKYVDVENGALRGQMRDLEHQNAQLNDRISDMDRVNSTLKEQCVENDSLMAKFAEDIRCMDVEVDRRRREQEALNGENRCLRGELEEMMQLKAKFDQTRLSLEEETDRRFNAE